MPNVMATLPNIGGAFCQRRKVWLTPAAGVPCCNAAKTRNLLKFAGVPQTHQQISAASGPKFTILWGRAGEILLFNKFFFRLSICALVCEDIAWQSLRWCAYGIFLCPVFPVNRMQHISDMHSKFALRPHHVRMYGIQTISDRWD